MSISQADTAFLFDVDKRLLNNDRVSADPQRYRDHEVVAEHAQPYWCTFEQRRTELEFADSRIALQRCRGEYPRDPLHDQSFAAAYAANIALSVDPLGSGYSFWTFTDIFEENYVPSVPFHGGFGLLNLYGIPKPVYRAFELLHGLGDCLYPVHGSHDTVEVWVSGGDHGVTVFVTNYAMPRHEIATQSVRVRLGGVQRLISALLSRIDDDHANPRRTWQDMGEPDYPSPRQVEALHAASALRAEPHPLRVVEGHIEFDLVMPPQSIAALKIELTRA